MPHAKKVTISLPQDILEAIDRQAVELCAPRSAVIASMLRDRLREAEEQLMKEGYLAMAEENLRFAEESIPLAMEVLPAWDEDDDQKG